MKNVYVYKVDCVVGHWLVQNICSSKAQPLPATDKHSEVVKWERKHVYIIKSTRQFTRQGDNILDFGKWRVTHYSKLSAYRCVHPCSLSIVINTYTFIIYVRENIGHWALNITKIHTQKSAINHVLLRFQEILHVFPTPRTDNWPHGIPECVEATAEQCSIYTAIIACVGTISSLSC